MGLDVDLGEHDDGSWGWFGLESTLDESPNTVGQGFQAEIAEGN
jgi:hypothetical protein